MANISKIKLPNGNIYNIVDKTSGYATEAYVDDRFDQILDGVTEEELNTFKELSDALNDDENFATAVNNELAKKSSTIVRSWTSTDV